MESNVKGPLRPPVVTREPLTVIDGKHALIDGVRTRVFPGTGRRVEFSELMGNVDAVGSSVGLSGDPVDWTVTLVDSLGNWTEASPSVLIPSPIWPRLPERERQRILVAMDPPVLVG